MKAQLITLIERSGQFSSIANQTDNWHFVNPPQEASKKDLDAAPRHTYRIFTGPIPCTIDGSSYEATYNDQTKQVDYTPKTPPTETNTFLKALWRSSNAITPGTLPIPILSNMPGMPDNDTDDNCFRLMLDLQTPTHHQVIADTTQKTLAWTGIKTQDGVTLTVTNNYIYTVHQHEQFVTLKPDPEKQSTLSFDFDKHLCAPTSSKNKQKSILSLTFPHALRWPTSIATTIATSITLSAHYLAIAHASWLVSCLSGVGSVIVLFFAALLYRSKDWRTPLNLLPASPPLSPTRSPRASLRQDPKETPVTSSQNMENSSHSGTHTAP